MRKMIVDKLGFLGIKLDESVNDFRGEERVISTEDSPVKVIVIPTNEEFVIANDTYNLVK
jgi:acetate kinase